MNKIAELIAQNPVFKVLPPAKQETLMQEGILRRYSKGHIITHTGDIWPYLFIVANGTIDALKVSCEGRSLTVTTFGPGDVFWGLAFFDQSLPMLATLKTCVATEILIWSRESLLPYLKDTGAMSWELSRIMVEKMTRASEILEEMTFQPVAGRLAKLLLETSSKEKPGPMVRTMTLDEMAARIGSTREVVCRFLHRFADDGIIDITRTEFQVTDSHRLLNLAQNSKG